MSWFFAVWLPTQIAEFFIAYTFFKDFLGTKYQNKKLWAVCIIAFVVLLNLFSTENAAAKIALMAMLCFALTFMFDGSIKLKLLANGLFYVFILIADYIAFYGLVLVFEFDPITVADRGIFPIVGTVTSKLIALLIVKIVGSFRNKNNTRLSLQHWIAIAVYPIISCFLLFVIIDLGLKSNMTGVSLVSATAAVCVLYFNILAFHFFEYFAERSERDLRERLLKSQVASQLKEMERQNYEKIAKRSFLHDLRHHNQLLYKLVEKGEASAALDLISKMLKLNESEGEYVHTSNTAINALFNSHLGYAESQGIRIDVAEIHLPSGIELDIEDICIIFANSLENAIEACQRVDKDNRFIKITLNYRDNKLVYKITNPTDGNVVKNRRGGFKSTKTTPGEHGLGVENIEKAVAKYGGVFNADHSDNTFTLGFSISFAKRSND